jgi:hypothetical protein
MKPLNLILIFFVFLTGSCTSWKRIMVAQGNQNDAVQNAIKDFLHTDKYSKKDTVFSIRIADLNGEVLGVSIGRNDNRLLPGPDDKIGTNQRGFPTRYFEQEGKLFYWYDSTYSITRDLIHMLSKYHRIDSLNVNGFIGIPGTSAHIDDSNKGTDYYFCKRNLLQYKKIHNKTAMGWYEPPELKCNPK